MFDRVINKPVRRSLLYFENQEIIKDVIYFRIIFHFYNLPEVVDKVIGTLLHNQYDNTNSNNFLSRYASTYDKNIPFTGDE